MNQNIDFKEKKDLLRSTLFQGHSVEFDESVLDSLVEHVDVHQYFQGQQTGAHVEWSDAVFSWIESVLDPITEELDSGDLGDMLDSLPREQQILSISDHWYFLKEANPQLSAQDAASDFARHYSYS